MTGSGNDMGALGDERTGDSKSNSSTRAGHESVLTVEAEIHGCALYGTERTRLCFSGLLVHDEYGSCRVRNDGGSDAAGQVPDESSAAVGADDDEAGAVLLRRLDDPFPGRGRLDCQDLRREPCTSPAFWVSKCCSSTGRNPTSAGCQTQRTSPVRPGASCRPACSIASWASSEPS